MAIEITTALQLVLADAIANAGAGIDFDAGVLEIRTGAPPDRDAADSGTLLASITLPADAFGAAAGDGQADLAGTWEDPSADATGVAGHWRLKQAGDAGGATGATDERIQGTVGAVGSGEDLELVNTSIAAGQPIEITSFFVRMPGA